MLNSKQVTTRILLSIILGGIIGIDREKVGKPAGLRTHILVCLCPLENGKFMPDAGAIIAFIKAATEREPIVIGKPNKYMVDAILNKYSLKKEDLAIVGDRLYTDIRTGIENGIDSILVLSGETDKKMLETTEFIPDYVFDSVKDIISLL